jgi:hypothetical protein
VVLAGTLGGPQLSMMRQDPPSPIVDEHEEHGVAIVGKPLDAVTLAAVGPSKSPSKDLVPGLARLLGPLQG